MKIESLYYRELDAQKVNTEASLVLFAFCRVEKKANYYNRLKTVFPNAAIALFSTAGHFIGNTIEDQEELISVLTFEKSTIQSKSYEKSDFKNDLLLGETIGREVDDKAQLLLLISDGNIINGTELILGINSTAKSSLVIVGGMAGDGTRFEETHVGLNEEPNVGRVAAISILGEDLIIKTGHDHGWSSLGLEFQITKADKNQLFELNHKNAYKILREFMHTQDDESFTRNVLFYPFLLEDSENEGVIRTPIALDHVNKILTYAGNMPVGAKVKLMKTRTMQLLDAVLEVASKSKNEESRNQFVLAISCVGRRVVLGELANEEYTELYNVFGKSSSYFGFYSYGEFSPSGVKNNCKLHNQTLTLAIISEKE
jgi:hypothetical protein